MAEPGRGDADTAIGDGGGTMDWDFRTEYAKNYSVSVQQQLAAKTTVEVSFLRSAIQVRRSR